METKKSDLYFKMSKVNEEPFAFFEGKGFTYREAICEILNKYGLIPQIIKSFEEIAELQELLAKVAVESIVNKGKPIRIDNKAHIAEELADVIIMLSQIMAALGLELETEERMKFKLTRQLSRIRAKEDSNER